MKNKMQNIKIKILIPYKAYENLILIYRKPKPMSELEAIILSFIYVYSTNQRYKTQYFFEKLYERLNLNKNKWHNFILEILKELVNEKIIINNPNFEDDNLLCHEVELNKKVVDNLNENKFISIDNKDIEEHFIFNKIVFESTDENKNHIIINKKLNEYNNYVNEINYLIKFIEKNGINKSDENAIIIEAKNLENDNKYFLNIKEFDDSSYDIKFNLKEINDVQLLISDDKFELNSLNKNNEDIINKYKEYSLDNFLLYTFKDNEKYLNNLKQKDEYDLIPNINEYEHIINNKKLFSKYNKGQKNICILNNGVFYEINKKSFYWKSKNNIIIDLLILNQKSILNHIMNEIDKYNNGECIDLVGYLNQNEKITFNKFIYERVNNYLKDNKIKKYFIDNILTNETKNDIIWTLLNLNDILLDDWELIMKKLNINKINSFLEEYKNTKALEEELVYKKVKCLIELNNLEIFEKYFELSKFENINNYLNKLNELSKEDKIDIDKLIENKNLLIKKIENEIKFNYELNNKYKETCESINNKIDTMKGQMIEEYFNKNSIMNIKLESILKKNEDLTLADIINKYIKNKELKKELHEIKEIRNKFAHLKEDELPDENNPLKILELVKKIDEKIIWLENNRERINNEIEKNKSENGKGEK